MDISKYILELEHLSNKMLEFELKLPDKLCLKFLDGASLNTNQKQMALTIASNLKYESIKAALKQIFISIHFSEKDSGDVEIKQESISYTKPWGSKQKVKLNPISQHGQVFQCAICDSKIHWAKQCPHHFKNSEFSFTTEDKFNDEQCEDVQTVLITDQAIKNEIFLTEMVSSAVIDTAHSRTVAGKQ